MKDMRSKAPVKTGELLTSGYGPILDVGGNDGIYAAKVGFDAPQADYTDLGTQPHLIVPSTQRRLRFFWPGGPEGPGYYSFSHVNHPGYDPPGHWFSDIVDRWEDYVQSVV
jgi:hypothetical protein